MRYWMLFVASVAILSDTGLSKELSLADLPSYEAQLDSAHLDSAMSPCGAIVQNLKLTRSFGGGEQHVVLSNSSVSFDRAWLLLAAMADDHAIHQAALAQEIQTAPHTSTTAATHDQVASWALICSRELLRLPGASAGTLAAGRRAVLAALLEALAAAGTPALTQQMLDNPQAADHLAAACPAAVRVHCSAQRPVPLTQAAHCLALMQSQAALPAAQDCLQGLVVVQMQRVATRIAALNGFVVRGGPGGSRAGETEAPTAGSTHPEAQQACWMVVGAGPVGLAGALQWLASRATLQQGGSAAVGADAAGGITSTQIRPAAQPRQECLHVVEPRLEYTRDTWFDLASAPWYSAGLWLWQLRPDTSAAMQARIPQGHPPFTPFAYTAWLGKQHHALRHDASAAALRDAAVAAAGLAGVGGLKQALGLSPPVSPNTATEHFTVQCRDLETWLAALLAIVAQPEPPQAGHRVPALQGGVGGGAVNRMYGWRFLLMCPAASSHTGLQHALLVSTNALELMAPSPQARKGGVRMLLTICGGVRFGTESTICRQLCESPLDKAALALQHWMAGDAAKVPSPPAPLPLTALRRPPLKGLLIADGGKSAAAAALGIQRTAVTTAEAAERLGVASTAALPAAPLQEVSLVLHLRPQAIQVPVATLLQDTAHTEAAQRQRKQLRVMSPQKVQRFVAAHSPAALQPGHVWALQCPELERDPSSPEQSLDPWAGSFQPQLAGNVTTVFKRWYRGACHMQVLTTARLGSALLKVVAVAHAPLHTQGQEEDCSPLMPGADPVHGPLVDSPEADQTAASISLQVLKLYLAVPPASASELLTALCKPPAVVPVPVVSASHSAVLWPQPSTPSSTPEAPPLPALLLGDAAATAHYRLGIGINSALSSMAWLHTSLMSLFETPQEHLQAALGKIVRTRFSSGGLLAPAHSVHALFHRTLLDWRESKTCGICRVA